MLSRMCIPHGCGGGVESEHTSCNLKSVSLGIVSHRFMPITCSWLTGYMIVRFCSCRRDTAVTNCQSEFTTIALSLNFFLQMSESCTTLFPRSVPFHILIKYGQWSGGTSKIASTFPHETQWDIETAVGYGPVFVILLKSSVYSLILTFVKLSH